MGPRSVVALLALLSAAPARAWDSHGELTRLALAAVDGVDAPVVAEPLDDYLSSTGRPGGVSAFLAQNKLNPKTTFAFRAGEAAGRPVPLLGVLAAYSDEPDWDMDNDMFASYPELWKDEYRYMGGRSGPQTRAIRHMHWPRGYMSEPKPGSRIPTYHPDAIGVADERADLFFKLSRQAFAEGHPYWGGRFLAWSLHYVEDLTQPFHAVQLPAFDLLRYKPDGSVDLEKTTRAVVYYHLAFDGMAGATYRGRLGAPNKARLEAALAGASTSTVTSAREFAVDTAMESSGQAKRAALAAIDFFPDATDAVLADPLGTVWGGTFWGDCAARLAADPEAGDALFSFVEEGLSRFGPRARGLATAALSEGKAPGRLDRVKMLERLDRLLQRERAIIGP